MGKTVKLPCKHVISFRVNERERELLDHLSTLTGMNVSTIMRLMMRSMGEASLSDCVDPQHFAKGNFLVRDDAMLS